MPADCYKVEVLHLLNPHLIWVEVKDSAIISTDEHGIKFEQIGIYGVLPLETTIDLDDDEITVQRCQEWLPACATLMRKYLTEEEEISFTPVHLERRSSIFDDNVHNFGDLIIQKKNGRAKSLTKLLCSSGFAVYNASLFHQYLSEGKIITKLNNIEIQQVLAELEKYFMNKNVPKKKWEKPIHKHTSVVRVSNELEETLTKTNLDKHNKNVKTILESKNKDLELCKGVDELSVGRATTRGGKEKTRSTPVEKKIELLHSYKNKADFNDSNSHDHSQAFEESKVYLEAIASPYTKKISSKTDAHKAQILKKVMSKSAIKKGSKQEKLVNSLLNESKEKSKAAEVEVKEPICQPHCSISSSNETSTSGSEITQPNQLVTIDLHESSETSDNRNMLDTNNDHDVNSLQSVPESEEIDDSSISAIKINQETLNIKQDIPASSFKIKHKKLRDSKIYERRRNSTRGKLTKKSRKPQVYIPTLESEESLNQDKNNVSSRSTSPQQRLAYPPQKDTRDQDLQIARRVPELPNDSEAFATTPVSEYMVKKLMNTFKLTGSKHSDMIQNAIRKCKDGTKNNTEAIAALLDCRDKILDEIKELENPQYVANLSLDLSLPQTVPKR